MKDDATADHLKPSMSDEALGRAALRKEGDKRHGDVTLAELQAQFALLQHEFELFQEGRTRPPTRARNDDPAGPDPDPKLRSPGVPARADCRIATPAVDTPRSQSVPSGARMLHNPSPPYHRPDLSCPRQPSAQPPTRISRPLHAVAAGSPASAVPPRPRPSAPVSERRLPSPTRTQHPRSAGKAHLEQPAVNPSVNNSNKPQEKKVKKIVERPPWRDDFAVDSSPWSQELAQEQAIAGAAVDYSSRYETQPACAPKPDRGRDSKERERQWPTGSGSDGDSRDTQASPVRASKTADTQAEDARSMQAPARRRPQPATAAGARAAAVAAVIEAGRQQHAALEQQQAAQQQVARGGQLLDIPRVAGPGMLQPEVGGIIDPGQFSPSRASQIPTLPSPGPDSRPRTQQSRIPTFPGQLQQQPPRLQQQETHRQDDRNRRQSAPFTASTSGGPLAGNGVGVDRLVVDGGISTSFSSDDQLGNSVENSHMPPSSIASNSQPQRRRRQWEVPGGAVSGSDTSGNLEQQVGVSERRLSSSDEVGDRAITAVGQHQVSIISPSSLSQGRTFNPTPPASRPPSRPGSRPGSRPTSNTGDVNPAASGHQPPSSPPAYSDQDALQHSSPERPRSHRVSSTDGNPGARGGTMLPISEIAIPEATFAGLSAGGGTEAQIPEAGQIPMVDADSAGSFQLAVGPIVPCERTAELIVPISLNDADSCSQKAGIRPGRGQRLGPGLAGPRDEEYFRKLSALKRSVPHEPLKRVTEDGGTQGGAVTVACGAGSGGVSVGQSRKWMEPGNGDAPLSLANVEAVGSAPAAVRAARSRNLTADVPQGSKPRDTDVGGGSDALDMGKDSSNDTASTAAEMERPSKTKSQVYLGRGGSFGDMAVAVSSLSGATGASRISDSGQCTRAAPQMPAHVPEQQRQQHHVGGADGDAPPATPVSAAPTISAEQYMAFAVQNPEVAMAAAQAAINAGNGRARARWNVPPPEAAAAPQPPPPGLVSSAMAAAGAPTPPPPGLVAAATAAAGGAPPLVHQQQPWRLTPPPQQQQLAAAMVSATSHVHDLRRANSEGPRMALGRGPGFGMVDMAPPLGAPPTSAPSGHGPGGFGPLPPSVLNNPFYSGGHPQQPPLPPPMVQSLFPGNGDQVPFSSNGQANSCGMPDDSGRHAAFGPGGPYPSALQPIRPAMAPPGEAWAGGSGAGLGPTLPLPYSGFPPPPPPHWHGYSCVPGRHGAYTGMPGVGPGLEDAQGPTSHTGPIGDPFKPFFKRNSNGHHDGFGGAGIGFASAPQPVPGYGSGGGSAGSSDLPDYLRVSMSRMVAGWSAPNAKHGALSGFNDVWQHRNNNRPPAGLVTATHSGGSGAGWPESDSMAQAMPVSSGGGGVRETGFEGLSLAEVLASKPKKEMPNFKKKT